MSADSRSCRSALFVDFDNIYSGLSRGGGSADEAFGRNPVRWLRWLEESLEVPGASEAAAVRRRILVRRCYLNPKVFGWSRPYFIRAGFEVVDTPALTSQGKTSADVQMALDIVNALNHATRFDEFIVFSGDADFTPVLRRLREHDRRTSVLATGPTAAAYRSACDLPIEEERFVEEALQITEERARPVMREAHEGASDTLIGEIGERLKDLVRLTGRIEPVLLPRVYKEFREFAEGENWLGYRSLRGMTEAIVAATEGLTILGEDPWWVGVVDSETEESRDAATATPLLGADEQRRVEVFVAGVLEKARQPLDLASLAHLLMKEFGEGLQERKWGGAGSFKAFLERMELGSLRVSTGETGYIYDPERHPDPAEQEDRDAFAEEHPELARVAASVHELTDAPYLSPEQFAVVLGEMASEINENGFHLTRTSKAIRDRCYGKGMMVARSAISSLLKGLSYSGYPLRNGEAHSPAELGEAVTNDILALCSRAQMEIDEAEREQIRQWVTGALK